MKPHASGSRHSLSTLTKNIKALALNHRPSSAFTSQPVRWSPGALTTFPRFFDLPPEIRLLVYEQYFADSGDGGGMLIAPKSHPRTRYATALLLASRQLYNGALPVMYNTATMTLDLIPRHHAHIKSYAYFLDHVMLPGLNFAGNTSQILRMTNIHLTLGPRPSRGHALRLPGEIDPLKWWQYTLPIFATTSKMFPTFTLALYVGDITSIPPTPPAGLRYRSVTFATFASRPYFRQQGWRDNPPLGPECKPPGAAKRFRALSGARREVFALATVVYGVGVLAERLGEEMSVENHDRTRRETVVSDKLPDLVESARRVVGDEEEKGVWLVLGDKNRTMETEYDEESGEK